VSRRFSRSVSKLGLLGIVAVSTAVALGLAACSTPVKFPTLGVPPEQHQDMTCDALNAESTRLLAERAELKSPLPSANTDTEREAEVTQLNGKL
jgi:hypothetical protein